MASGSARLIRSRRASTSASSGPANSTKKAFVSRVKVQRNIAPSVRATVTPLGRRIRASAAASSSARSESESDSEINAGSHCATAMLQLNPRIAVTASTRAPK